MILSFIAQKGVGLIITGGFPNFLISISPPFLLAGSANFG